MHTPPLNPLLWLEAGGLGSLFKQMGLFLQERLQFSRPQAQRLLFR